MSLISNKQPFRSKTNQQLIQQPNLNDLSNQILKTPIFLQQLQKIIIKLFQQNRQKQKQNNNSSYETMSSSNMEVKKYLYPWEEQQGKQEEIQAQFNEITDEISQIIEQTIDNRLDNVLSKQFLNLTNQMLIMREQITQISKNTFHKTQLLKSQLMDEIQKMNKKITQQNHIKNSFNLYPPVQKISRTRITNNFSLSGSNSKQTQPEHQDNKSFIQINQQIIQLKKQMQIIKKKQKKIQQNIASKQILQQFEQKMNILQDKLSQIITHTKISLEQYKQTSKKSYEALLSQIRSQGSKNFIQQQIKRSLKSHLKIYLEQLLKVKKDVQQLYDRVQKSDKGLQNYLGSQLKNVWTFVSEIKKRLQNIEQQFQVNLDQSFVF